MYAKYFYELIDKYAVGLSPTERKAFARELQDLTSRPPYKRIMTHKGENRCICCQGIVECESGVHNGDSWKIPSGAIVFKDVGNYGSRLNDSAYDAHYFEVMICDECLEANRDCIEEWEIEGALVDRQEAQIEDFDVWDKLFVSMEASQKELDATIALQKIAEEKYKNGSPASELTPEENDAMAREYGENWEEYLAMPEEEKWTPERGQMWHEQAVERAREARKQRLLEAARKLLKENREL